jgi:hypothetical protein
LVENIFSACRLGVGGHLWESILRTIQAILPQG